LALQPEAQSTLIYKANNSHSERRTKMALWKPFRGSRASLETQPLHDGYVYFCTDDGSLFFDYTDAEGNLQRKQISASDAETLTGLSLDEIKESLVVPSTRVTHGESLLSNILETYILNIDYENLLAFDTSEIITSATSTTSAILGQAI
jgi:hypothetical protein